MSNFCKFFRLPSTLPESPVTTILSRPSTYHSLSLQPDHFAELNVYEAFFKSTQHPALILDLNVNSQKARPRILNSMAHSLLSSCNDFFKESQLEKFNGSFDDFIYSAKRKVEQEIRHSDLLHVLVKSNSEAVESIFSLTASTFNLGNDTKMLGILLIEITKSIKEELSALERFKESLISALSHELNNPMNSLIPLLNMMPSYTKEDKKEDYKEMALASANILRNKIRDLIDYTKIQQETIRLDLSEFYVEDLFEEIYTIFKYEAGKKHNKLVMKTITQRNKKLLMLGDRDRIEQILVKLMSNANKYTENGHITLIAEENKNNFNIAFSVEDTGIGMPPKKVKTIFAPLPEKARNLDAVARLPGLGLEIAKSLCQYMDCKLNVASEVGKGTKFHFELPVCRIAVFEDSLPENFFNNLKFKDVPNAASVPKINKKVPVKEEEKTNSKDAPKESSFDQSLRRSNSSKRFTCPHDNADYRRLSRIPHQKIMNPKKEVQASNSPLLVAGKEFSDDSLSIHRLISRYNNPVRKRQFSEDIIGGGREVFEREPVVLVVDDGYSNIMVITEMLKKMKIKSIGCLNGKKGVEVVEESFRPHESKNIELILMDLNMPIMNGVEATIEIRRLERKNGRSNEIPIVAVTGQEGESDKNICFKVGMQEYVRKPVNPKILNGIVSKYAPKLLNTNREHDYL